MATKLKSVQDELDARDAENAATMRIWNAVCKTDPKHTKRVNQRGGFTAIDAQYQIMEATRQFGPVGEGWGYDVGEYHIHGSLIIVPVTLWHGSRDNKFGPVLGCCEIAGQRPDRDAPKKAVTDAITKGLSQLGFNADVFLGLFDDNKYVEQVRQEFADAPANDSSASTGEPKPRGKQKLADLDGKPAPYPYITHLMTAARQFVHTLEGMSDMGEFLAWGQTDDCKDFVAQCKRDLHDWYYGGGNAPGDWVPLQVQIQRKRKELEEIESLKVNA